MIPLGSYQNLFQMKKEFINYLAKYLWDETYFCAPTQALGTFQYVLGMLNKKPRTYDSRFYLDNLGVILFQQAIKIR